MFTYFVNRGSKESRQDMIIEIIFADIPIVLFILYSLIMS